MKFWLSKNPDVPVREQLATQIVLGIVSNDLKAGERLPSTRDLSRRLGIHANTVSAVYRSLEDRGWLSYRQGSGVYVAEAQTGNGKSGKKGLDELIAAFLRESRQSGYNLQEIRAGLERWLGRRAPSRVLLIESDEALREILVREIQNSIKFPVVAESSEQLRNSSSELTAAAVIVAMPATVSAIKSQLSVETPFITLRSSSVQKSLVGAVRPPEETMITVVSGWDGFLERARTILIAAGISPDAICLVNRNEKGWQKRLGVGAIVIADIVSAGIIRGNYDVRVFRVIAESSLEELSEAIGEAR
jgi:DNA-binding transcriptional regulator YhcF (GntR family)